MPGLVTDSDDESSDGSSGSAREGTQEAGAAAGSRESSVADEHEVPSADSYVSSPESAGETRGYGCNSYAVAPEEPDPFAGVATCDIGVATCASRHAQREGSGQT